MNIQMEPNFRIIPSRVQKKKKRKHNMKTFFYSSVFIARKEGQCFVRFSFDVGLCVLLMGKRE